MHGLSRPGPRAAELIQEVSFDQGELKFTRIRDFDLASLPGTDFTREVGAPMLPAKTVHILLPPGSSFEGIEVVSTEREGLGRGYRIFPCQPPAPMDGSEPPPFVSPSSRIYDSLEPYPSLPVLVLSESRISGYHLVSIRAYPLTYVPATGELILNRSLALAVSYQPGPPPRPGRRISLRSMEEMNAFLGSMVHNPEQLSRYGEELFQVVDTRTARPLRLEVKPSRRDAGPLDPPGQIEYIVVTTEELAAEFEPLVDWKTRKGIPAAVATLEWIVENVPNGCDLQETIRNFLIEAKQDHPGLAYVLIGGDVDVVPARMAGPISGDSRPIPTDLYYADIDPPENDWNADGDWHFGETGDGADAVPDLFVGRAPISTPLQAASFVEKILFWERELPTAHQGSVLMLGASAGSGGDGTGAINKKAIGADFIPPEVLVYYLCAPRDGGGWACDDELTRTTALYEINARYGLINHQDHSSEYCIGAGSKTGGGTINRSDMDSLVNGPFYSILWTLGCSPGAFDYDCALEHFVRSPGGGGPAAVGNSRTGYWSQNSQDRAFMEAVYQLGMNLGQAHSATKTAGFSLYHRYIQNILGDPELPVNTDHLGLLALDLPPQATTGPSDITITVYDNKSLDPVEGAVVCAMKGNEDYAVGITDEQGRVIFSFDPNTPGEILVTATKANYYPAEASIPVVPRWVPHIYLSGWDVDDDGSGSSSGNGDGVVDAGESVEIPVTLANSGLMPAYWVLAWIELVEPVPYVSIVDGYEIFYTMAPGGEVLSPDDFDVEVSPDCPAGHTVEVRLWIWGLAAIPWSGPIPLWWTDTFDMEVSAPELCIVSHSVDDDNGNGLVDPGETVELPLVVKNFSGGTAVEVDGTIVVSSVDVDNNRR